MVTKHLVTGIVGALSSVLAKILMVTKHMFKYKGLPESFCSSKNPYGNKTIQLLS